MGKEFVRVVLDVDEQGKKTPKIIIFRGEKYEIDKVSDIRQCASFKAGGVGERYTIRIGEKATYLYFENGRWFVESLN